MHKEALTFYKGLQNKYNSTPNFLSTENFNYLFL